MYYVWGRGEVSLEFWWENLRQRDYWGDSGIVERVNIKIYVQELGCGGMDWI
jgi:hypothetical protein